MRRLKIGIIFLLLITTKCFSQGPVVDLSVNIPQPIPPTPDVASLIKVGWGSANLSTGAVNANIPLYSLDMNGLSFPLNLSYSSQGVKVDDPTSRVGFGWAMNLTGVINRVVKDNPDDLATRYYPPENLSSPTLETYQFAINASSEAQGFDTEPDEYIFSFPGHSGKFVIDSSGKAVVITHDNLRISGSAKTGYFVITTTNGVKYFFGGTNFEKTLDHNLATAGAYKNNIKTAFFLYRVETPNGDFINFNYSSITTSYKTGTIQTYTKVLRNGHDDPCNICPSDDGGGTLQTIVGSVEYATKYLSSIVTSNGLTISFSYESRPDLSGDKRLKYFSVVNQDHHVLKSLRFEYYDLPGTTSNKKFFLTKIVEVPSINLEETYVDTLVYNIDYYQMEESAQPNTFSQDQFGFYNGKPNINLIPEHENLVGSIFNFADRSHQPHYAIKGMLKSIKYPTGGEEVFYYEPNMANYTAQVNTNEAFELAGGHLGGGGQYQTYTGYIEIRRNQSIKLNLHNEYVGNATKPLGARIVHYYMMKNHIDTILDFHMLADTSVQLNFQLYAGNTYTLKMLVKHNTDVIGYMQTTYDTSTVDHFYTAIATAPGLRLRQIEKKTNLGISDNIFYTYSDYRAIGYSSGSGVLSLPSYSTSAVSQMCPSPFIATQAVCRYTVFSTNTSIYAFPYDGSHFFYRKVIESNSPNFKQGGTEYTFFDPGHGESSMVVWGDLASFTSKGHYGGLNGRLSSRLVFDSLFAKVTEEEHVYELVNVPDAMVNSVSVFKKYQPLYHANAIDVSLQAFDIVKYFYRDIWVRLKEKINKQYIGNEIITSKEMYNYNSFSNVSPSFINTLNSKGDTVKVYHKFPTDYVGNATLDIMKSRNIIGTPVESESYVNQKLLTKVNTVYKNWLGADSLILPEMIQKKTGTSGTLDTEVIFEMYDNKGNLIQMITKDSIRSSFAWGYNNTLPIAQVINAKRKDFFYTSFEDEEGNSNFLEAKTGSKSRLGGYTKVLSNLTNGNYILSYWKKSGNIWTFVLANLNILSGSYTISIGETQIDELRFHPIDATMSTFTYIPFVGYLTKTDINNRTAYYEYDGLNRLSTIKDDDNNILKKVCYTYDGQLQDCSGIITYFNVTQSNSFYRNNCYDGESVMPVTFTVKDSAFRSTISQLDADAKALNYLNANGQAYANLNGICNYYNDEMTGNFIRQCAGDSTGTTVAYTVPARKHMSAISKSNANFLANNDLSANGQGYANANGNCFKACTVTNCVGNNKKCINNNCETGVAIEIDCEFDPATNKYKYWHVYQFSDNSWSTYTWYTIKPLPCPIEI